MADPVDHSTPAVACHPKKSASAYLHYLTGCRELFRDNYTDVCQFALGKSAA